MKRRFCTTAIMFFLSMSAWSAWVGAESLELKFSKDVVVNDDRTQCRFVVAAADSDAVPLRDLNKDHFSVSVDGKDVDLLTFERTTSDDQPLAVALVLDISKSMNKGGAWRTARSAAIDFIRKLDPQDQVCLITIGSSVNVLTDFTKDKDFVQKKLIEIEATENGTLLYDALFKAASQATLATTGKTAVIAITDGKDEGSTVTIEDAAAKAQSKGIPLYTLGFGPQTDRQTLQRISTLTGGEYRYALKAEELTALYGSILEKLKDGYAISVKTSLLRAGSHTLSIALNHRNKKAIADKQFVIPYPPIPRWAIITSVSIVGLLTLLSLVALAVNRIRRKKRPLSQPSAPIMWLDVVRGPQKGRRVRFQGRSLRIGKTKDCALQLIDDPLVSSDHAEIVMDSAGTLVLSDRGSENGTILNGNRLEAGQNVRLRGGDRIIMGSSACDFVDQRPIRNATAIENNRNCAAKV